jgi:hypothetical protein
MRSLDDSQKSLAIIHYCQRFPLKVVCLELGRMHVSACHVIHIAQFRSDLSCNIQGKNFRLLFWKISVSCLQVAACRLTGGLSGELTLSETTNQTFEEHLTWSVDSQVKVEKQSRTVASLMIREEEVNATIKLDTFIKARQDQIPVYIKHKKTGKQIKRTWLDSNILSTVLNKAEGFEKIDDCSVKRESKGVVRLIYGAEQVIDLKTIPLKPDSNQLNGDQQQICAGIVQSLDCWYHIYIYMADIHTGLLM